MSALYQHCIVQLLVQLQIILNMIPYDRYDSSKLPDHQRFLLLDSLIENGHNENVSILGSLGFNPKHTINASSINGQIHIY